MGNSVKFIKRLPTFSTKGACIKGVGDYFQQGKCKCINNFPEKLKIDKTLQFEIDRILVELCRYLPHELATICNDYTLQIQNWSLKVSCRTGYPGFTHFITPCLYAYPIAHNNTAYLRFCISSIDTTNKLIVGESTMEIIFGCNFVIPRINRPLDWYDANPSELNSISLLFSLLTNNINHSVRLMINATPKIALRCECKDVLHPSLLLSSKTTSIDLSCSLEKWHDVMFVNHEFKAYENVYKDVQTKINVGQALVRTHLRNSKINHIYPRINQNVHDIQEIVKIELFTDKLFSILELLR